MFYFDSPEGVLLER